MLPATGYNQFFVSPVKKYKWRLEPFGTAQSISNTTYTTQVFDNWLAVLTRILVSDAAAAGSRIPDDSQTMSLFHRAAVNCLIEYK